MKDDLIKEIADAIIAGNYHLDLNPNDEDSLIVPLVLGYHSHDVDGLEIYLHREDYQEESEWIKKLRIEVMMSKMIHNFTFSRDEVMELLKIK